METTRSDYTEVRSGSPDTAAWLNDIRAADESLDEADRAPWSRG